MNIENWHNIFSKILEQIDTKVTFYLLAVVLIFIFLSVVLRRKKSTASKYSKYQKIYQVSNIITDTEVATLSKKPVLIELDTIIAENSKNPTQIYTVLKTTIDNKSLSYDVIHHHQHIKFLAAYRNQRWDMAITIANSLKTSYDGSLKKYYTIMIDRCQHLKKHPPGNTWQGIWNRTIK